MPYGSLDKKKAYMRQWYRRPGNHARSLERQREYRRTHREQLRIGRKQYRQTHADEIMDRRLRTKYGITLADYTRLLKHQHGKCAICRRKVKKLCVDHNHKTGQVRALLCTLCNTAIGSLNEDLDRLHRVQIYLETFNQLEQA